MKNLFHQTKQAFLFSLAFYFVGTMLLLLQISFAPIVISVSLLLSLIWVALVLLEIMRSPYISNIERLLLAAFIILLNIVAGIAYFYFIRTGVTGQKAQKK